MKMLKKLQGTNSVSLRNWVCGLGKQEANGIVKIYLK